jgi:hypothetical protein
MYDNDNELIKKYSHYIGQQIEKINPYDNRTAKYALYELGLLRAVLARCMLNDNKNSTIFDQVINSIDRRSQDEQES